MKKTFLILFAFAIAIVNGKAQEKKGAGQTPEQRTEKMLAKLNEVVTLSDDQKAKAKPVILKRETERTDLKKKYPNKDEFKKANRENMKKAEVELKKILTAEQAEKLKKHREEMKEKRKAKKASGTAPEDDDED
ncbi:MAG: hypothetical protein WAQ28_15970 [Bacteroidia bacterium]